MTMDTAMFLAERDAQRRESLSAADACLQHDPQDAIRLLHEGLHLTPAEALLLLSHLQQHLPLPAPAPAQALLAETADLPPLSGEPAAPWIWRERLEAALRHRLRHRPRTTPLTDAQRLAWGLLELSTLGKEIERRQRAPWRRIRYPSTPALEATTAALWAGWFSGNPWQTWGRWETLFLDDALRAFAAVLRVRRIPPERRDLLLEDMREAFLFMLLGDGQTTPGWRELAVRVLELGDPDPIVALSSHLDAHTWLAASACAVQRGYGPRSAALLFPTTPNPALQARRLARQGLERPQTLDEALDLHIACRLIDRWATDPETTALDRSWQVIVQNRGRARARLRALLAGSPTHTLQEALLSQEGLYPRTRRAIRIYARDWAWIQFSRQFPFHVHLLDPPCQAPDDDERLFSPEDDAMLRTWVLLVLLKGRLDHLDLWIQTGGTNGDRDATWGRLLLDLPDRFRSFDPDGRASRGQHRLRAELADRLPETLETLRPLLQTLAQLPAGRAYGQQVNTILDNFGWNNEIPRPLVRRQYHDHITAALERLHADLGEAEGGP